MNRSKNRKPWKGRFTEKTDAFVEQFTASLSYDKRLYAYDIQSSIVHGEMLAKQGLLTNRELNQLREGLETIRQEMESGQFVWSEDLEDVHMNVEARLVEKIGAVGQKLQSGRSRNDQITTDLRLLLREHLEHLAGTLIELQQQLLKVASRKAETIMPGFTHLQIAQPITLGFHLMAWISMLERDQERLTECRERLNHCPLGSAALAGTGLPIDRVFTAQKLGFKGPTQNSLDAVSDRDFVVEYLAVVAILMLHLSRISEELVLWASPLFGFVELPDRFCTGSSLMPQKKNPDICELVRGKTGRVYGHLMSLLTLMKAQPLSYNRDNQEDKEALFDTVDTVQACVTILLKLIPVIRFNRPRMKAVAKEGFSTATDLAEYLVKKGVPFRQAHEIVGKIVAYCAKNKKSLTDLTLKELKRWSPRIEKDVAASLTVEGSVAARNHIGGTAPEQVKKAISVARKKLMCRIER